MSSVKLKDVVNDIEKLRNGCKRMESLAIDQIRDGLFGEAKINIKKMQEYRDAIKQMENLNVQIEPSAVNKRS